MVLIAEPALMVLILATIFPLFCKKSKRLTCYMIGVSLIYTAYYCFYCYEMNTLLEAQSSLEGPNGEGSPLAPILGVFFLSLIWVLPWVSSAMRGIRILRGSVR